MTSALDLIDDHQTTSKLAPELLTAVLQCLDASKPEAATTLCRFATACRHFEAIAGDPKLWKALYLSRWRRHRSRAEYLDLLLRDGAGTSWRAAYAKRHLQDSSAGHTIEAMCKATNGRFRLARDILKEHKMDVFDRLLAREEELQTLPRYIALNTRLWTSSLLGALRRSEALQVWMQMVTSGGEISFVTAIGAFSGFRGCDRHELDWKLDLLARRVEKSLGEEWLAKRPHQVDVAKRICEELFKSVAPATDDRDFLKLQNHFLNLVLDG